MPKQVIYFIPGLGANSKIFEYLSLSNFDCYFLEWLMPINTKEPIEDYAKRMSTLITHKNPILVGVSFGGVIAQEISKHIPCKKIILISSIKSNSELPKKLRFAKISTAYKLFPNKIIANIEKYEKFFLGNYLKKRIVLYKKYLSVRNPTYLQWAIYTILHWQQKEALKNSIHIHGTKDEIFPIKNIQNTIKIKQGTHVMILRRAKEISIILENICSK